MMLDRKEIQVIFLFELTMGHKSTNTTHNINNAFAQELLNGSAVQSWFKKFCKGDESLEDEESSGQPSAGNNKQLRAIIEANPLTITWEAVKELSVNNSTVTQLLKQIERWKSSISGYLKNWPKIKKNCSEVSFSLILQNNEPFLYQIVTCDKKWILYNNQRWPAQWLDWEEAPKHFPKVKLAPKKIMVTVCRPAAHLIHNSFLNSSETITFEKYAEQINEMHWKLNTCSQHWSTERAQFFSMTMPNCTLHNQCFRSIMKGNEILPHLPYSPNLATTDYLFFKPLHNFLQGKCFHNQQEAENAFQEFFEAWIFTWQE